jgi:hypothetical protein
MITINARTKATTNTDEHEPQVYSKHWPGLNITPGYIRGWCKPNYPTPAVDYYNSNNPSHLPIGYMMEWSIPVDIQLRFRASEYQK